jgi:hypothetical protein
MQQLSQEYLNEMFSYDPDTGVLIWKTRPRHHFPDLRSFKTMNSKLAGKEAGAIVSGYRLINHKGTPYRAHRLIWIMVHGHIDESLSIDHIDGNGLNNRISNLRLVSHKANLRNQRMRSSNTSGFTGVSFVKGRGLWEAHIGGCNGKKKTLGQFANKADAIAARRSAELELGYHPNHGKPRTHERRMS